MSTLFGADIQLDAEGDFVIDSGGDLMIATELDCLIQDVKHRLITYPGDLFYDESYGVGVQEFTNSEDSEINRLHLTEKINLRLSDEPRIEMDSITASAVEWKNGEIIINTSFIPIGLDNPVNVTLKSNSSGIEVV